MKLYSNCIVSDLSNDIIPVSSSARNLGFIFDSDMSFSDQINSLSKSCHFHIRDIRRIRHLLPLSAATALVNSLVSSKLNYCNSLYSGISQANLNKLQRIQNSLARVITNTSKYQHITPTLKNYTGFQSNKELSTNSVFSHTKHSQINSLHIFTIVFHFRHILSLQEDLLIHSFFPFHIITWQKGVLCHWNSLWNSLPPDTLSTSFPFQAQNTPLQNCIPSLDSFRSPWTVYPDFSQFHNACTVSSFDHSELIYPSFLKIKIIRHPSSSVKSVIPQNHSSKSNHSVLETFLLLSLLRQLNSLLATMKLSFLISIVLHLLKYLPFLTNSKTFLNFLFLYPLN